MVVANRWKGMRWLRFFLVIFRDFFTATSHSNVDGIFNLVGKRLTDDMRVDFESRLY